MRLYFYISLGLFAMLSSGSAAQVPITIIDTGSTNRPGLQVTTDAEGSARVEQRRRGASDTYREQATLTEFLRHPMVVPGLR